MVVILTIVAVLIICSIIFIFGAAVGGNAARTQRLAELGITEQTATLYPRAVRILAHLHGTADTDHSEDHLSPQTRSRIAEWIRDYRNDPTRG